MIGTVQVSVFLVEDDEQMLAAFERMVTEHPALKLAGTATTIADARRTLPAAKPEVAIVDLGLPDGDGVDLIKQMRSTSPKTVVLVSTVFGDEANVIRTIEAGASGYLLKDTTLDEFARSILLVKNGDSPLSPQIARHLLKRFAPAAETPRRRGGQGDLTRREMDILTAISRGFSVSEAALMLGISHHTVLTHIKNIYGKLSVNSRVQALNKARMKGLIH